jgi:VPS inhibitor protein E
MESNNGFCANYWTDIPTSILNQLTTRMIALAPSRGENTVIRNSTLEKAFLAFEIVHSPSLAENHFYSQRMKEEFKGKDNIQNLKTVILTRFLETILNVLSCGIYSKSLKVPLLFRNLMKKLLLIMSRM